MLRLIGFLTLVLVAACLAIGASIALASENAAPAEDRLIEAVDPDRRMVDESLVSAEDVYEFDFPIHSDSARHPEFVEPSDLLEI